MPLRTTACGLIHRCPRFRETRRSHYLLTSPPFHFETTAMSENVPAYASFFLAAMVVIATMPRIARWYYSPAQIARRRREAAYEAERYEQRTQLREIEAERSERRKADAERRIARSAVFEFYDRHYRYLGEALPEALIDARITSGIQGDTPVVEAWNVAGDLLVQMNAIVLERREVERRERSAAWDYQRRLFDVDREIDQYVLRLKTLESSPMRAEVADEILVIHERLSQLERDRLSIEKDSLNEVKKS